MTFIITSKSAIPSCLQVSTSQNSSVQLEERKIKKISEPLVAKFGSNLRESATSSLRTPPERGYSWVLSHTQHKTFNGTMSTPTKLKMPVMSVLMKVWMIYHIILHRQTPSTFSMPKIMNLSLPNTKKLMLKTNFNFISVLLPPSSCALSNTVATAQPLVSLSPKIRYMVVSLLQTLQKIWVLPNCFPYSKQPRIKSNVPIWLKLLVTVYLIKITLCTIWSNYTTRGWWNFQILLLPKNNYQRKMPNATSTK